MLSNYAVCINKFGKTEQYCAAYDKCISENINSLYVCNDVDLFLYHNQNWIAGTCINL